MPLFSGDLQLHFLTYSVYRTGCSDTNKQKTYILELPKDGGATSSTPFYGFMVFTYMLHILLIHHLMHH